MSATELDCVPVAERDLWESHLSRAPRSHFTQAWCYGEGKRATGWAVERLCIGSAQAPVALCQVLVKRCMGLPLVSRINRGPLFVEAATQEMQLRVLRTLRRRWRLARRGLLLIAPALPAGEDSTALMRAAGFAMRRAGGWGSAVIGLSPELNVIRGGLSSKWRNHLNASLRAGLETETLRDGDALEWMLERHRQNMASKRFAGPDPRFVRALVTSRPDDFVLFRARRQDEPCCAILVARHGSFAETFISWTSDVGRQTRAHHLLLWRLIEHMKQSGCTALDLGGYTTSDKYGAYKRAMKGVEYRLAGEWFAA